MTTTIYLVKIVAIGAASLVTLAVMAYVIGYMLTRGRCDAFLAAAKGKKHHE